MSGSSGIAAEGSAVLAAALADIQGFIGLEEQVIPGRRIVGIDGRAHRNGEAQDLAVDPELAVAERLDQSVRHDPGLVLPRPGEDDLEFIAAEAGDRGRTRRARDDVLGADGGGERFGDMPQDHVPGLMAVPVVDLLEVVDVDHDDRHLPAVLLRAIHFLAEPLLEVAVIPQMREAVLVGLLVETSVLDGDRGVRGEDLGDLDLAVPEGGVAGRGVEVEGANVLIPEEDRNAEDRAESQFLDAVDQLEPRLGNGLRTHDALACLLDGEKNGLGDPAFLLFQRDSGTVTGELDFELAFGERDDGTPEGAGTFKREIHDADDDVSEVGPLVDLPDDVENRAKLAQGACIDGNLVPPTLKHGE